MGLLAIRIESVIQVNEPGQRWLHPGAASGHTLHPRQLIYECLLCLCIRRGYFCQNCMKTEPPGGSGAALNMSRVARSPAIARVAQCLRLLSHACSRLRCRCQVLQVLPLRLYALLQASRLAIHAHESPLTLKGMKASVQPCPCHP